MGGGVNEIQGYTNATPLKRSRVSGRVDVA